MPVPERKEQKMSFPQHLVELVRNELREFSADDPEASGLLDQDAVRILGRLAEAGVEFPDDPRTWTPQRAAGEVLGSCDAINSGCDGGIFLHRLRELGWDIVLMEAGDG